MKEDTYVVLSSTTFHSFIHSRRLELISGIVQDADFDIGQWC